MAGDGFAGAVERVLRHEGGWTHHPADPGGCTNMGITLPTLRAWRRMAGTQYVEPGCDDIRALTRREAVEIYHRMWWVEYRYARLPEAVGAKVFDLSINMGPSAAHKCLQRALAAAGHWVKVDGIIGPKTLAALAGADHNAVMAALRSEASGHYRYLAARNAKLQVFLPGWLNRAYA